MVAYEVVRDKPMYNVKFIHWCLSKTEMTNELVFIVSWGIFYLYALWDNDIRALLNEVGAGVKKVSNLPWKNDNDPIWFPVVRKRVEVYHAQADV